MINFFDEVSVQEIAKARREGFLEEARRRVIAKSYVGQNRLASGFRRSLGQVLIRIGQHILHAGA